MKPFFKRVTIALCTGYIIVYYGEFMFWATPEHEGYDAAGFIAIWLAYSVFAYPFLCVTSLLNVRDPWAVFLARRILRLVRGGHHGPNDVWPARWLVSRVDLVHGLAWHALLDVWIGWYLVRNVLSQNKYLKTAALAGAIGLFYGFWGIWWWNQPPPAMKDMLDMGQKGVMLSSSLSLRSGRPQRWCLPIGSIIACGLSNSNRRKSSCGSLVCRPALLRLHHRARRTESAIWVLPPLWV